MDTDRCPKCDATTVVGGRLGDNWKGHKWFEPSGMRFFNFRLRGWGISRLDPIRACLSWRTCLDKPETGSFARSSKSMAPQRPSSSCCPSRNVLRIKTSFDQTARLWRRPYLRRGDPGRQGRGRRIDGGVCAPVCRFTVPWPLTLLLLLPPPHSLTPFLFSRRGPAYDRRRLPHLLYHLSSLWKCLVCSTLGVLSAHDSSISPLGGSETTFFCIELFERLDMDRCGVYQLKGQESGASNARTSAGSK